MGEGSCRCEAWPTPDMAMGGSPSEDPRGMKAWRARGMGRVLLASPASVLSIRTENVSKYAGERSLGAGGFCQA